MILLDHRERQESSADLDHRERQVYTTVLIQPASSWNLLPSIYLGIFSSSYTPHLGIFFKDKGCGFGMDKG
jgi:hypothetical protein